MSDIQDTNDKVKEQFSANFNESIQEYNCSWIYVVIYASNSLFCVRSTQLQQGQPSSLQNGTAPLVSVQPTSALPHRAILHCIFVVCLL